jgi:dihydrofolate synthase / folylpolyglutamate synthase
VTTRRPSASSYLAARVRFGIKFGLGPMRALMNALGHPELAYPTLLVAGTNGKGSVVAYVAAGLRAAGLRVGRYTSPHLVRINERIAVGGRDITDPALERAVARVRRAAEELVRVGRLDAHPTFFEVVTAAAFHHFRAARVDVAVLEVGMGGRLDATNVAAPLASAIVSIAADHETYLGAALPDIAREKAGVLRAGRAAVLGPLPEAAAAAIAREAAAVGARTVPAADGGTIEEARRGLDVHTAAGTYRGLRPLPGRHQRANLLVAVRLLEEARAAGLPFDLRRAVDGVSGTRWPGRLQLLPGRPPLLLDGAHNPAGAQALAEELRGRPPFVLLFGVMADKDVAAMGRTLFPLARAVVLTRVRQERAATPREIRRRVGPPAAGALEEPQLGRALDRARRLAGPSGLVVVAGSLYLIGEVLGRVTAAARPPAASRRGGAGPRRGRTPSPPARPRRSGRRGGPSARRTPPGTRRRRGRAGP